MKTPLVVGFALAGASMALAAPTTQVIFSSTAKIGEMPVAGLLEHGSRYFLSFESGGVNACNFIRHHPAPCGTVVRFDPPSSQGSSWHTKVIYRFRAVPDASSPRDTPTPYNHGNLVLTTAGGGDYNQGALVELIRPPSGSEIWTEQVIHSFNPSTEIYFPDGAPHVDRSGNVFVSGMFGGHQNLGGVVEFSPPQSGQETWTETVIHTFSNRDSGAPVGGIRADANGDLFIAAGGGPTSNGAIVELSPPAAGGTTWTEAVLHSFGGTDGIGPDTGLIADANGNFFGLTVAGGVGGWGTVFELSPPNGGGTQWGFQVLYGFTGGADGGNPGRGLARDAAGNLFVTTGAGGDSNCQCGTLVELSPPQSGQGSYTETTLHQFTGTPDGFSPSALTVEDDGNFLIPTFLGGQNNEGALIEVTNTGYVIK